MRATLHGIAGVGDGGPGQLHSPMSTGEDSLAKSLIFGTIKDVAVALTTREYSGQ